MRAALLTIAVVFGTSGAAAIVGGYPLVGWAFTGSAVCTVAAWREW